MQTPSTRAGPARSILRSPPDRTPHLVGLGRASAFVQVKVHSVRRVDERVVFVRHRIRNGSRKGAELAKQERERMIRRGVAFAHVLAFLRNASLGSFGEAAPRG